MSRNPPHQPQPALPMRTWTVVADGTHNAFTDLHYWREAFWLVYVSSPSHFASPKSRLVLLCSADAVHWEEAARFSGDGQDIRDPKLAVIQERLVVYALLNQKFDPQPYRTVCASSADGRTWSPFTDVSPDGWLLGKPKSPDGRTWYAPAHHLTHGEARLLRSQDSTVWETHAVIRPGGGADETALTFTPDGDLLCATRIEGGSGLLGSPRSGTLLSYARPPYSSWEVQVQSAVTRLDGPALFTEQHIFAVGRCQPTVGAPFQQQGSILSRKRSAIFLVREGSLVHLVDLPTCGDTAYAGVTLHKGQVFISYYTNPPGSDLPWILGMFRPTQIQITQISLSALADTTSQH